MASDWTLRGLKVTPIAFRDPPLLNASGIHEPWALRAIVELEASDGRIGIAETYGDQTMLDALAAAAPLLHGLSPFDLNLMEQRIQAGIKATPSDDEQALAPGSHGDKNAAKVTSALEVAMLDLQGQRLGAPVCDLLGGALRAQVPYSAYLFFKHAQHVQTPEPPPYPPDAWGEALTPQQIVAQAQRMIGLYGFGSIKLKGGVFEPAHEIACMRALREAFPGLPLRLDPNANWSPTTSVAAAAELDDLLEYYEDPTPSLSGMAQLTHFTRLPLATNMVVTTFDDFKRSVVTAAAGNTGAVQVVLSDHHYWGGLRATLHLARLCDLHGLGMSMHSNSHLGPSLMAMTHAAACVPNLAYACDTHYPWQEEEVIVGGRVVFADGTVAVPRTPGLGVELDRAALARLHEQYLACGIRTRNDLAQMRKRDPAFAGIAPRY